MNQIPVFKPLIEQEEIDAAASSLEGGWLGMGASVGQFEAAIKDYIGCEDRHVVALSTGHAALHLAMLLIGLKAGDEVITPSFNNIADFQAILAVGAKPVFCDIDDNTLCIDLQKAEKLIGPRTRAMIVMDYDCIICDHDEAGRLAEKHGIRIIHDAAHAFGSEYKGRKIGSFSDICMFSFDPVKTITCIDGGALIVKTEEEMKVLQEMRLIGMGQPSDVMYQNKRAWTYGVNKLGFRYHMANLHAAIGLKQLEKMDFISSSRREACRYYSERLSKIGEVKIPQSDFESVVPFLYYMRVERKIRSHFIEYLSKRGVDTGIHWQPGHWFELFKDCRHGGLDVTENVGNEILSLPLHSGMNRRDQEYIVNCIEEYFDKSGLNS